MSELEKEVQGLAKRLDKPELQDFLKGQGVTKITVHGLGEGATLEYVLRANKDTLTKAILARYIEISRESTGDGESYLQALRKAVGKLR